MANIDPAKTSIDAVVAANLRCASEYDPTVVSRPRLQLAVVTCMDTRLSFRAMGLQPGDAHLIRNAGGIVTGDVVRSLVVSKYFLGTREIMIVNHTDCGMMKATDQEMHQHVAAEAGVSPSEPVSFHAFTDLDENVRQQMRKLRSHSWLRDSLVRGFVFDVASGRLGEVRV